MKCYTLVAASTSAPYGSHLDDSALHEASVVVNVRDPAVEMPNTKDTNQSHRTSSNPSGKIM